MREAGSVLDQSSRLAVNDRFVSGARRELWCDLREEKRLDGLHGSEGVSRGQGRLVGWAGGVGEKVLGALMKSKNSVMSGWAASRRLRLGSLNRFSTNLSTAV